MTYTYWELQYRYPGDVEWSIVQSATARLTPGITVHGVCDRGQANRLIGALNTGDGAEYRAVQVTVTVDYR